MNQDFQYLLSLIFCIILVIKLFIYEKQKQTDLYFYISINNNKEEINVNNKIINIFDINIFFICFLEI